MKNNFKNLRVAHISGSEKSGGSAFYAYRLFKYFLKKKISSKLFVLDKDTHDKNVVIFNFKKNSQIKKKLFFFNLTERNKYSFYNYGDYVVKNKSQINGLLKYNPNLVIIYNNTNFLDPRIIKYISDQKIPVFFYLMDLEMITGGCHYSFDCKNFQKNCNDCPAIKFIFKNLPNSIFIKKKKYFKTTNITFLSPTNDVFNKVNKTKLFNPKFHKNFKLTLGVDTNFYKPIKKKNSKKLVICFRSSLNPRKGNQYLIDSLNNPLINNKRIKEKISFNIIGDSEITNFLNNNNFEYKFYKNISKERLLIKFYNESDFFLSQSIQDIGPVMINESMACGLPVISFKIGIAKDVIKNEINGFLANKIHDKDLATSILKAVNLDKRELDLMKIKARKTALDLFDIEKNIKFITRSI